MKSGTRVLVALIAAMLLGFVAAGSGSAALLAWADRLIPIGTLWVNAIRMTVIPLVVALVITGVASAADEGNMSAVGGRTIVVFLGMLAAVAAVVVPLAPLAFGSLARNDTQSLPPGAAEAATQLGAAGGNTSIAAWVQSLLPVNPIAAASNGAMLQLVLFTICFAIAVAQLPATRREAVLQLFRGIGDAMQVMVRGVIALAPIGVFALVLPLAAHAGASFVGAIGLYIVAYSIACILGTLLLYPLVRIIAGIPMRRFAEALLPVQLIALTSSSSAASLPAMVEAVNGPLALPSRAASFVLPLAVSTFKLAAPVSWAIGACFIGWFYGVPLHASQFAVIAFAAVFLSFATPGVPNGAFLLLTPLFVQIGLPVEGIGVLIALDAIPDRFATVLNATGDVAAAAIVVGRQQTG
jgi:proton glutamate symport protein